MREGKPGAGDDAEHNSPILIAAKPDRMRDCLRLLLKSRPGITIVGSADDSSSVLRLISEHYPVLVLLDTNLPGEDITTVLEQVKASGPENRSLVLVENFNQQQEAKAAGADVALVKGFRTAKLFAIIERLLSK